MAFSPFPPLPQSHLLFQLGTEVFLGSSPPATEGGPRRNASYGAEPIVSQSQVNDINVSRSLLPQFGRDQVQSCRFQFTRDDIGKSQRVKMRAAGFKTKGLSACLFLITSTSAFQLSSSSLNLATFIRDLLSTIRA